MYVCVCLLLYEVLWSYSQVKKKSHQMAEAGADGLITMVVPTRRSRLRAARLSPAPLSRLRSSWRTSTTNPRPM